ncbi:cobyrinate a,c-diamide synthase [Fusobacterium ulcerans]|uniref:cobyrinate a,c-diamide synthase n=1 Tax=Fusobacterium ulcerans TaxID=861 RepID=UPI001032A162|nr:cobyrinate a,c-diamide synthase [Fusobacterium ulcerans]
MNAFMLAGISSGIGKTTVSMGLMSLFENVSPFKTGPDYIDPGFHQFVTGNKSYNLDLFMMGEEGVKYSFYKHQKDISIVEGVMGLYDGIDNSLDNNSSAHLSRVLGIPVILVVDGVGKSTSIAAQVLGYQLLDKRVNIAGVIINKVSSKKTYDIFKEAIEMYTDIKCLGYVPKDETLHIGSRHLGLLQAEEIGDLKSKILSLAEVLKETIDVDGILEIASKVEIEPVENPFKNEKDKYKGLKIGIAKDRGFSFYYNDNIELLEYLGAEIEYFSPVADKKIPENIDILYFGGGYPENFAKELSENRGLIESVREFYHNNGKIFGECGGFMFLSKEIETLDGLKFPMCNLIDCSIKMGNRLDISRFGYINLLKENKAIGRGHEFHYSKIKEIGNDTRKYTAVKKDGREWNCIFEEKGLKGGYPHIHFFTSFDLLKDILEKEGK